MLYRKKEEPKLSEALFQNPTSEYRGTPFWAWNCKVTEEQIDFQTEALKEMGMGGALEYSSAQRRATFMILSWSPTEVPPNFFTISILRLLINNGLRRHFAAGS